ncbi:YkvA family protein, partial [Nitrospirota bacterium]
PIDLMPEIILGPLGLLDDIAVATYVLHSVLEHTSEEVLRRHWAGDMDILETLQKILRLSDSLFGKQLWGRVRRMFS